MLSHRKRKNLAVVTPATELNTIDPDAMSQHTSKQHHPRRRLIRRRSSNSLLMHPRQMSFGRGIFFKLVVLVILSAMTFSVNSSVHALRGAKQQVKSKPCLDPSAPFRGSIKVKDGVAHYSCDRGYLLKGAKKRECRNGVWTMSPPACAVRYNPQKDNSRKMYRSGFHIGSRRGRRN